jgi:ribosomal protein S27AE
MRQSIDKKLLIAVYSKDVFEGNLIRQEPPQCCGKVIDLYNTDVDFKDIKVSGNEFTLLEPLCPKCGTRVRANYHTIH